MHPEAFWTPKMGKIVQLRLQRQVSGGWEADPPPLKSWVRQEVHHPCLSDPTSRL